MSWFEECFYHRLWTACDDYGRMDARPAILKARLFPLKERLALKDIEGALRALADIGCVKLYDCDGRPYLYLPTWEVHQNIRAKKSKYPAPNSVNAHENICMQMQADASKCPRNPIQSVSESNPNVCPEEIHPPGLISAITLTLNDKTEYEIMPSQVEEWSSLYPAVNVMQELRKMKGWMEANPKKRKTRSGILRCVTGWLSREQDKPHPQSSALPYDDSVDFLGRR